MTQTNQNQVSSGPHSPATSSSQYNPQTTSLYPSHTQSPKSHSGLPHSRRGPPTSAAPPAPRAVPMIFPHAPPPPPPPPPPSKNYKKGAEQPAAAPLYKQHSWSPDMYRDEAWLRRKGNFKNRRSKSVTDEDLDELKACFELGFGFDSSPDEEVDPRLSDTLPALGLYYAVNNKKYYDSVSKSNQTSSSSSSASECDTPSPLGSPHTIFGPGENPQTVKTRLRQWAQVVACSVKQFSR